MPIWNKNNIQAKVQKAVAAGKFAQSTAAIENIILGAATIFLDKGLPDNVTGEIDTTGLPELSLANKVVGRPEESELRNALFSSLFRAWMLGKGEYPTINNKGHPASPFVIFAEPILWGLGIGKIEDHLEEFRSFRKKSFEDSGFKVKRGKVD